MSTADAPLRFPINLGTPAAAVPPIGYGVCDPLGLELPQRMQLTRYATGAFFGAVAAPNGPFAFAAQALALFADGPRERDAAATGIGGVAGGVVTTALALTQAETNTFKSGALAPVGDLFKVVAIGCRLLAAGTYDPTTGAWQPDRVSIFYGSRTIVALYDLATLSMAFADEECVDELGPLADYPDNAGPAGADGGTTNGTPVAQQLVPLPYPFYAGGRNTTDQVTVTATLSRLLSVPSDGALPTAAAMAMQVRVKVRLFGTHLCRATVAAK